MLFGAAVTKQQARVFVIIEIKTVTAVYTSSALVLPGKTQAKWSNKEYAPMVVTECSERAIFGTCCGVVQKKIAGITRIRGKHFDRGVFIYNKTLHRKTINNTLDGLPITQNKYFKFLSYV